MQSPRSDGRVVGLSRVDRRRLVSPLGATLLLAIGACGGGGSPQSPTGPTSGQSTWSLSGTVTESAPTTSVPIAGAIVTIADGPNNGQSATTSASGAYQFAGLQQAGFTVQAAAAGYVSRSQAVTLTSNQTVSFQLDPLKRDFQGSCASAGVALDHSRVATTCTVTSGGFGNTVNLSCQNAPAGVSCAFEPNQVTVSANASGGASLTIDPAFAGRPGAYSFKAVGTGVDGLTATAGLNLTITSACAGFTQQASYTGNQCGTGHGICWGFRDGYLLFTPGEFFGAPGFDVDCGGTTVQVVRGSAADYQHVLGTIFLKRTRKTR